MQQLVHQLTEGTLRRTPDGRAAASRRRRLMLAHTVYSAPIFDRVPVPPNGRGMSDQAIVLTTILSFVAFGLLAVAVYQWDLIQRQHIDMERVRRESADRVRQVAASSAAPTAAEGHSYGPIAGMERNQQLSGYFSRAQPLVLMWRDAQARAELAADASMLGALKTLREVEVRTTAIVPPPEARDVHDRLLARMRNVVEAYELAIQTGPDAGVAARSRDAREAFESAAAELAELQDATQVQGD